jgi:hypothetical protein
MEKLQAMIDKAFALPKAPREPERPSEAFLERERAFTERAKKIELLRQARVAGGEAEAPRSLLFEVVRHRGHWRTLHRNRYSGPCDDQGAAILAARRLARKKRDEGHAVEIRLRRTDGQVLPLPLEEEQSE